MAELMQTTFTLGIDLGTSAVKVVLLDSDGIIHAEGSAGFAAFSDVPAAAEQDPADWISATSTAVAQIDDEVLSHLHWRSRVAAIGLTGQLPTLVCANRNGPLGRAITWKDGRADHWASAAIDVRQRRALYEATGMPIDGRYLGPMFRYHWHQRRAEVEFILSAKDYLCYELTGQRVTDPSTAAGYGVFDLARGAFSESLCAHWDLPIATLPAVLPAHSAAGPLNARGAKLLGLRSGISVTVGAADSVTSAFAMAGLEEGTVCVTMGSSTVIIDAIHQRRLDPATRYLLTPHVLPDWYGREMDLLATGTGYRWLSDLFGWTDGTLDQCACNSPPGARGITFAPYLAGGEQGALWNPQLRGSVRGLTLEHTANDIARAFLEGVCFEIRRCLDVLAETATVGSVVVAGHLVERPSSLQMLADVLQRPVQPFRTASAAALGAALGARCLADSSQRSNPAQYAQPHPPLATRVLPGPDSTAYQVLCANYLAQA